MRKMIIRGSTLFLVLLFAQATAALAQGDEPVPYQEGLHYFELDQAPVESPGNVEVTEFFSYLCTHCNTMEPYIQAWKKRKPENVEFSRVPVIFGRSSWEIYARAYVTAQMMNLPEESHQGMMDRLWKEKKIMRSMDEIADFYTQFGADKEKFLSTSKSFAVDGKIRRDQLLVQKSGIRGTPSLLVNGKYRVAGNAAVPSFEVMLDVVDFLVEKESGAKAE
jgi:thiol:disulfide interchange protein DsbA